MNCLKSFLFRLLDYVLLIILNLWSTMLECPESIIVINEMSDKRLSSFSK